MEILKLLFYSVSIFVIYYELKFVIQPKKELELSNQVLELIKRKQPIPENLKYMNIESNIITLWFIGGLFTFQWYFFLLMIIIQLIVGILDTKQNNILLHWFNSILGLAFGVFIPLNEYWINFDLHHYIFNY